MHTTVTPLGIALRNTRIYSRSFDDSSYWQRESTGDTSLDNRARVQDDVYTSSMEEDNGSGNRSSQRADNWSLPVRSNSRESGLPGTRSGRVQKPGFRHTPGRTSISRSGHGRNSHRDKRSRSKASSFSDSDESSSARYHSGSSYFRSRSRERSRKYSGKKKSHRHRSHSRDSYGRRHKRHRSRSRSRGDKRSRLIIIPEVGSDRVTSVAVLVDLPLSKKRGVEFLALLLLLVKTLYRMSFQGQLQIMSLKEKVLLLLLRSLFLILRTELRTKLLLIDPLRIVLSIRRKKMTEKSLMLRPLKKFLIFSLRLFVLGKNESSTPSKPRSGIDLLNPSEDKETSSLPQSQLVKDILNLVQTRVSDKVKLEPGWTAPISLEKELGTHMTFYKLHNEQFPVLRNGLNRAYCSVAARLKCQF